MKDENNGAIIDRIRQTQSKNVRFTRRQ